MIPKYVLSFGVFMAFFLTTAAVTSARSQEDSVQPDKNATKILFIGNSLTYFNDMPGMLRKMAKKTGKNVLVDEATMGGASPADHLESSRTRGKINSRKWDYVIIQQGSGQVAFPEKHKYILPDIRELKKRILDNYAKTRILFFMDISMKNGIHWNKKYYTYAESQDMLCRGTLKLTEDLDFIVAPVGRTWTGIVKNHPAIDLYHPDEVHPSYAGSYLQACVYFATIFRERAVGNGFTGTLDKKRASILQAAASRTVLDNPERWGLVIAKLPT